MKKNKQKKLLVSLLCFSFLFGLIFNISTTNKNVSNSILGTPTNLVAECTNAGSINLSWNSVENANGYEVWQSVNGGNYSRVQILTNTVASYSMLNKDSLYSYKVCAWEGTKSNRNCGELSMSVEIVPTKGNNTNIEEIPENVEPNSPMEPIQPPTNPIPETPNEPSIPIETPTLPPVEKEEVKEDVIVEKEEIKDKEETQDNLVEENDKPLNNPIEENDKPLDNPNNAQTTVPKVEEVVKKEILLIGNKATRDSICINWEIKNIDCDGFRIYQKVDSNNWKLVQTLKNKNTNMVKYNWLQANKTYEYKVVAFSLQNGKVNELLESNIATINLNEDKLQNSNNTSKEDEKPNIVAKPDNSNKETNTENKDNVVNETANDFAVDIFNGTNNLRLKNNLKKLVLDETLNKIAMERAKDMANNNYFSHYKDGKLQLHTEPVIIKEVKA